MIDYCDTEPRRVDDLVNAIEESQLDTRNMFTRQYESDFSVHLLAVAGAADRLLVYLATALPKSSPAVSEIAVARTSLLDAMEHLGPS
jgi:hypothetical protein